MNKTIIILACLLFLTPLVHGQENGDTDLFKKGIEAYASAQYEEALNVWLELYRRNEVSSGLYYNLGNAYYKLNNISGAILMYERAARLKPLDESINHNLSLARLRVTDRFNEVPDLFYLRWFNTIALLLTSNQWALLTLGMFISGVCLILYIALFGGRSSALFSLTLAIGLLLLSIFSLSLAARNKSLFQNNNRAVVIHYEATGMSSPGTGSTLLFVVHEGTILKVGDRVGEWYEVVLPDGNIGWVLRNSVEMI